MEIENSIQACLENHAKQVEVLVRKVALPRLSEKFGLVKAEEILESSESLTALIRHAVLEPLLDEASEPQCSVDRVSTASEHIQQVH